MKTINLRWMYPHYRHDEFVDVTDEVWACLLYTSVIVVYLFVMDWRMALLSLVTLVVGLAVMFSGMNNYPVKWEGAVKAGKQMANAIVEYIGGIEVVKANLSFFHDYIYGSRNTYCAVPLLSVR